MQQFTRPIVTRSTAIPLLCCVVFWMLCGTASAQGLFTQDAVPETFIPAGPDPNGPYFKAGRMVEISGDTALVVDDIEGNDYFFNLARVFERDPGSNTWRPGAGLLGSQFDPATRGAIDDVAISGNTAIVSDGGFYAYIFERDRGGVNAWDEVRWLPLPDEGGAVIIIHDVAISGNTAVVAAIDIGDFSGTGSWEGLVYVFERNQGGAEAWGYVTTLRAGVARPHLWPNTVAISGDTILVGAVEGAGDLQQVHVFERNRNGANAWGFVTRLPYGPSAIVDAPPPPVAIDANTAVVGGRYAPHVFERNRGGANAWGGVPPAPGVLDDFNTSRVVISGDVIVTAGRQSGSVTRIGRVTLRAYARNQHGANAWGEIASPAVLEEPRPGEADYWDLTPAISGDTVVVGVPRSTYWGLTKTDGAGAVFAFGADVDGDGMRDGLDPCPRDPYNNIAGRCRRASSASAVVDTMVALSTLTTASTGADMTITASFTNTSLVPVRNPFFTLAELSGGNVLKNADGGPGGVGATLSADVGNGVLEPGESVTVTFVIGLASRNPFRFFVHVQGDL